MNALTAATAHPPRAIPSIGGNGASVRHTHMSATSTDTGPKHQAQYSDDVATFFRDYNAYTARPMLYAGYIASAGGRLLNSATGENKERIAVDFGCGTGWLTPQLADLGFDKVVGIDTSKSMLRIAYDETRLTRNPESARVISFHTKAPANIRGKCSFVTAVHVHYHFEPRDNLEREFFGEIASMLAPEGEAIIIGCPSDHLQNTPFHYQNYVSIKDVPSDVWNTISAPEILADNDNYIALRDLPPNTKLQDGTQMKVKFYAQDAVGKERTIELTDTYWSDEALIDSANRAGLSLVRRQNLTWVYHPNAYMVLHFRKSTSPAVVALGS